MIKLKRIMQDEIKKVIKYFSLFDYFPTFDEIYTFLPIKTTKKKLKKELKYSIGEYSIKYQKSKIKYQISENKIREIQPYIKLLAIFPQIKLIGLSGTVAMMNAKRDDDIDLFIITAKNGLWTGRFIAILLAQTLNLRRKRGVRKAKDKICLNLFFDESALEVPDFKKTEYVAHEILQMKPLINKDQTYERFLKVNDWVIKIFPNAKEILNIKNKIANIHSKYQIFKKNNVAEYIEKIVGKIQLFFIRKHQTNEIITDHQLWFFPQDFENKLKSA